MSLCVLMSLQQQVYQPRDSARLPQRRLIGGAQCQVPYQTNRSLERGTEIKDASLFRSSLKVTLHAVPPYGSASHHWNLL